MNIGAVMDDLGTALEPTGLRVSPYWADKINPSAAIVGFPESYLFDNTMGRGSDRATFPVMVLVSRGDARSARDSLSVYTNGSGASSVKQAVQNFQATAYDSARVISADFGMISVAGVEYLAATFLIDIIAPGAV